MVDPFLIKAFFFRFLNESQVVEEFEKEIQNIEETLGDLANLEDTVTTRADEHGKFIYRTAVMIFQTMLNAYADRLADMKST